MACNQTINGLIRDCATSIGGIVEAYIVNYDDVTAVAVEADQIKTITLAGEKKFKKFQFRRGTGSMSQTLQVDNASGNNYVQTDVVIQFNKMETTKRIEMAALSVGELVVIVKDANGLYWYLGYDEPVMASAGDGQTGTARGDANRYTITLQDNAKTWPYEVPESVVTPLVD